MNTLVTSVDAEPRNDGWAAFGRDALLLEQVATFHRRHRFACAVETGTWKGHTTVALARMFPRVYTIEVDADGAAFTRHEGFKIAERLGAQQGAEGQALTRNINIFTGVGGELQEEAVVPPAFVQLPGGVQETRTKTKRHGAAGFGDDGAPQGIQFGGSFIIAHQVGVDGDVIARPVLPDKH